MDIARSLTYMVKQPGGLGKIIIGGILMLIPIVGWLAVGGYMIRTTRSVALGSEELPDWGDWGDLLTQGLILWVASLIYNIPGFILGQIGFEFLGSLWGLVVFFVLPAAIIRYAVELDFGAFLDFSQIIAFIQNNLNNYVIAVVVVFVAWFIALFGIILLIIGIVFTLFWAALVAAHAYGSVYLAAGREAPPAA